MMDADKLQARAKRRLTALRRAWRDPRHKRVIGRFVAAGVLTTTMEIEPHRDPITIKDALWAGRTEPRVLELLPALIVKRPSLFDDVTALPGDLDAAVRALRKSEQPAEFRGIDGAALLRRLPSVGHRGKLPSRLKSFRLQTKDLELLEALSNQLSVTQTEVLRRSLRRLAASELLSR